MSRMMRMCFFRVAFVAVLLAVFLVLPAGGGLAYESVAVHNDAGHTVFQFNYFLKGEKFREEPDFNQCGRDGKQPCTPFKRNLNRQERMALERAGKFWAQVLGPGRAPVEPLSYDIYPFELYGNASAGFQDTIFTSDTGKQYIYPATSATLLNNTLCVGSGIVTHHADVYIGVNPYDLQPSRIQVTAPWNLEMVMIHEFGHSLGILYRYPDNQADIPAGFPGTPFESLLRYDKSWEATRNPHEPRWFFYGPKAMAVYGGPVPMEDTLHGQEKGHFGLRNTSMTHRKFRNYTSFVEVEMAALVDIGYNIDLREYFGRSVYTDNNTIVNTRGFFARNQTGTAWIKGKPNQSRYGMGLHIYGNGNTIVQAANLLADGPGAAGIRSDGADTRLSIAPGVRVTANGPGGTGLLVAYGRNNIVVHQGSIEALGREGDAVRFDIGTNALDSDYGNNPDYYGALAQYSYLDPGRIATTSQTIIGEYTKAAVLLNGPLVDRFDISGKISGSRNAILISGNSHVREINIMRGAELRGRIVSDYYLYSEGRATELTFGRAVGPDGQVLAGKVDPGFRYLIRDDILGWGAPIKSGLQSGRGLLNLTFFAGETTVSPEATIKVNRVALASGAALLSSPNPGRVLRIQANDFALAPGSRVGLSKGFHYGPKLEPGKEYPVLSLELLKGSSGAIDSRNGFILHEPVSVGIYDYPAYDLRWQGASADSLLLVLRPERAHRNRQRAADHASGAPLRMILSDQGWSKVVRRPSMAWAALDEDSPPVWHKRVWGGPYYSDSAYDRRSELGTTKVKTPGVILGFEGTGESFMAGVALAAAWPDAEGKGYDNQGQSWSAAVYTGFGLPLGLELGAAASFGITGFEQERSSEGHTYTADYNARIMRAGLTLGRRFIVNERFSLRPELVGEYNRLWLDGYDESGWGPHAQSRDSATDNLWRSNLGLEATWQPTEAINLSGRLGWAHMYGDRKTEVRARFIADRANFFKSRSDSLERDSMSVGLNTGFALNERTSLKLEYQGEYGPHTRSHGGEATVVFEF